MQHFFARGRPLVSGVPSLERFGSTLRFLPMWGLLTWVPVANAQIIERQPKAPPATAAPAEAAAATDDDILAPQKGTAEAAPAAPVVSNKTIKVGLLPVLPLGDAGQPLADEVTAALVKELSTGPHFDVSPLSAAGTGATVVLNAEVTQALADGRSLLDKGQGFLSKLQFGKARAALEQALAKLEAAAPALEDPSALFDARVALAEVFARQGQDAEAQTQLRLAAVLQPERDLDAARFPPPFVKMHQEVRVAAIKGASGVVLVDASAAGSLVFLDGKETIKAPVKLSGVPEGRHLVTVKRAGFAPYATVVDVKDSGETVVSPGFIVEGGKSYVDQLTHNRFDPSAMAQVQAAIKEAGVRAGLVGVVAKKSGNVTLQLLYVDAAGGASLPVATFQEGLLDLSIESLKVRDAVDAIVAADKVPAGTLAPLTVATLVPGAEAGAAVRTAEMKMRYDVKAVKAEKRSRLTGDTVDEDGERAVLSAGKSGTRQRLDDEDDPYANTKPAEVVVAPDAPLWQQPWFLPAAIGVGVGAVVVVAGAGVLGGIAAGIVPDPRPADRGEARVTLPQ